MTTSLAKSPPRYFAAVVSAGLVAGLLVFLVVQAAPILGWILWGAAVVAAITGAAFWYRREFARVQQAEADAHAASRQNESDRSRAELRRQRGLRRAELMTKYAGDLNLVERIVLGTFWNGQTAEQLKDALGNPADIAARFLLSKRQEVWKYHPVGGNRYALWITLEQDQVVRWEERP
ncbi:MAG: hypothetical protein ABI790_17225 [Betaproteobacteria bacterium]